VGYGLVCVLTIDMALTRKLDDISMMAEDKYEA